MAFFSKKFKEKLIIFLIEKLSYFPNTSATIVTQEAKNLNAANRKKFKKILPAKLSMSKIMPKATIDIMKLY